MSEPRLREIAKDFVNHYSGIWESGKAMFICVNKVTTVMMFNYVQEYWAEAIKAEEKKLSRTRSRTSRKGASISVLIG